MYICDKVQSSCWASQAVCETEKRRVVYICGWEILTDKEAFNFFAAWSLAWYSNEASRPSAPFVQTDYTRWRIDMVYLPREEQEEPMPSANPFTIKGTLPQRDSWCVEEDVKQVAWSCFYV